MKITIPLDATGSDTPSGRTPAGAAQPRPGLSDILKRRELASSALLVSSTDRPLDTFSARDLPMRGDGFRLEAGDVDPTFKAGLPDLLTVAARIAPWVRVVCAPCILIPGRRIEVESSGGVEVKGTVIRLDAVLPGTSFAQRVPHVFLSSSLSAAEAHAELFRQLWSIMERLLSDACLNGISDSLDLQANASAKDMKVSEPRRRAVAFALFAESDRQGMMLGGGDYATTVFTDALNGDLHHLNC